MATRNPSDALSSRPPPSAAELRRRLDLSDAQLLAECELHIHRTGGPGGQHRNKVASAIRLKHLPTGFVVTATERRSQHENRANAIGRLRAAIAIGVRCAEPSAIVWPDRVQIRDGKLRVSSANPGYWHVVALVLDVFAARLGDLGSAAERLAVSGSSLTRFLAGEPKAWIEANRIREVAGRPPLRP